MGTQQRGSRCAPRGMFPRVSPRPRSERAMRRGGLPSHGAEPFPSRVWVRRGSLTLTNITRGESGGYGAHRASPIPGFFYISLPHIVGENCSEAAPSRTRTACNAAGHSEQPPPVPSPHPTPTGRPGACWQSGTRRGSLRGRGDHRSTERQPDGSEEREQNFPLGALTTRFSVPV